MMTSLTKPRASLLGEGPSERIAALKTMRDKDKLLVHEIFASIQGESTFAGRPCVFVRTAVCHLRCSYCDTLHAFHDGQELSVDEIAQRVLAYQIPVVELTGGEPLLQPKSFELLTRLCDLGLTVLLETSGAVSIARVDRRVHAIVDVKTPGSREHLRHLESNYDLLWPLCELKFVICDKADYAFAKAELESRRLDAKCTVLFSPEAEKMPADKLAEWIVRDKLNVRFQVQLHKVLWGDKTGV